MPNEFSKAAEMKASYALDGPASLVGLSDGWSTAHLGADIRRRASGLKFENDFG